MRPSWWLLAVVRSLARFSFFLTAVQVIDSESQTTFCHWRRQLSTGRHRTGTQPDLWLLEVAALCPSWWTNMQLACSPEADNLLEGRTCPGLPKHGTSWIDQTHGAPLRQKTHFVFITSSYKGRNAKVFPTRSYTWFLRFSPTKVCF